VSSSRFRARQNPQGPYGVVANVIIGIEACVDQSIGLPVGLTAIVQHLSGDGAMLGVG